MDSFILQIGALTMISQLNGVVIYLLTEDVLQNSRDLPMQQSLFSSAQSVVEVALEQMVCKLEFG